MKSRHPFYLAALALAVVQSCASADVAVGIGGEGGATMPGGGGGGGGQSSSFGLPDAAIILPDAPPASSPDLPPCPTGYKQDKDGNFICCPTPLRILSIGQVAKYGNQGGTGDNTDAFQAFMNGNTNGTATMDMRTTFKSITADELANYDVVILQAQWKQTPYNPADLWTYTDADAAALRDWVKDKGGALVTMTGYWSDQTIEITPLNKLLAGGDNWSGISYSGDDTFGNCPDNFCYCASSSVAFSGWTTDYADHPQLTHDLKKVGVFHGRSVKCTGAECQVFAKDPSGGIVGVAKKIGNGRVFVWGDEWVTYTSQWGLEANGQYDDAEKYQQCVGHTPATSYSVPQFWYNAFRWLVPDNTCFTIIVPPTAPPGQQVIL